MSLWRDYSYHHPMDVRANSFGILAPYRAITSHFVAMLLLCGLLLTGCGSPKSEPLRMGPDQLIRLSDSEIRGLDPQKISDLSSMRIAADQFVGLTQFDGHGAVQPAIARNWQVSTDGMIWTFTLRDDARFSDGQRIDAALFVAIWQRLNAAETASPHIALFQQIDTISADTARQLRVTLRQPMPQLPALLAHPAMAALPLHIITAKADDWTADRPLITSGPYQMVQWRLNDHLLLRRNPAYFGPAPAIKNIIWKPVDDKLAAMRIFLAGEADIASDYPQSRHRWLMENRADAVRTGDYLGSYYFAFNTRLPPFDDVRVRRALAMTVNRQWIAKQLLPLGNRPAYGILPPDLRQDIGYRPDWAMTPLGQRQAQARRLLAAAGYHADNPLRFEIRINSSTEHRRMAVAMAAMWAALGVEARILNSEASLHFAAMRRGEFTLARSGWIADLPTPENFLSVHRSDAGAINYSGFASPQFDAALDAALAQSDPLQRIHKMRAAERILMEFAPVIALYHYKTGALISPRVTGWHDNAGNIHPSVSLSLQQP